ncbi:unnamed protein product [Phytophthora lilii]|uniref:RxLR effector protein n=1 Tax=Phytophthora lilii TaxID=2077276 RepID=A0A9W6TRW2_9STRA|nr:unnamed protein product [Phytophthora lilii]
MRLHFMVLMVVAALAASNGVASATRVENDIKLWMESAVDRVALSDIILIEGRAKRFLRRVEAEEADLSNVYEPVKTEDGQPKVFIEQKLQMALANPHKTNKLYRRWYKSGYTAKQVADELRLTENREIRPLYQHLSVGYAKYVKKQQSQESQETQ